MNPPETRFNIGQPEFLENDILDLGELLQMVRRRWKLIAGLTILALALAVLVTVNQTRLYTATSLVLIETRQDQVVDMEAVVSGLPADSATIESQVEILRSQALAERVMNELDLIQDPEFNPAIREESFNLISYLDPRTWAGGLMQMISGPDAEITDEEIQAERQHNVVVGNLQDRMQVRRRGLTYAIEINFTSEDPRKAARIANAFADLYIVAQLEARFEATRRANNWLRDRLESLREQVRIAETAAATFATENNLVSTGEATVNEQQISQINAQLVSARADLSAAEASYDRVRQIVQAGGDPEALNQVAESPTFSRLREQQASLRREEAELAGRYGDLHPDLINVRQEIRELDGQIESEMVRLVTALGNEVTLARNRVASLERSLDAASQNQAVANQAMVQLRELERTAESQRTLYETFLSRFNETREQEDLQTSDARIIAQATAPLGPSHPRPTLNLVLGGVLGMMGGFGLAFFVEWLDRGIRGRDHIERHLGIHQLAAVPLLKKSQIRKAGRKAQPEDFLIAKPLSTYAEAYRALKASIALSNIDDRPKTILVTSALPNEGKSTVAFSLARHAASTGMRTLLIDADLRHPQLSEMHKKNKKDQKPGLVDILTGESQLGDVVYQDSVDNLYFIFGGANVANPADLLESNRMEEFIRGVRNEFDLVILDSAPVLPVVDSRVLSRLVDTTIFTVRWNDTTRDAAAEGVRHLRDFDANIAGAVLNMVNLDRQRAYGYSGGSAYYYGEYRKYYSE